MATIFRLIWVSFEQFRVFGFLDCTDARMFCPGEDRNNPCSGQNLQRSFYSRYFRAHRLKFQIVIFQDGMIGSIFGCSICHNDNGVLNMSNLSDSLLSILTPIGEFIYPSLYPDAI